MATVAVTASKTGIPKPIPSTVVYNWGDVSFYFYGESIVFTAFFCFINYEPKQTLQFNGIRI
jgi:hypothetical protein